MLFDNYCTRKQVSYCNLILAIHFQTLNSKFRLCETTYLQTITAKMFKKHAFSKNIVRKEYLLS